MGVLAEHVPVGLWTFLDLNLRTMAIAAAARVAGNASHHSFLSGGGEHEGHGHQYPSGVTCVFHICV